MGNIRVLSSETINRIAAGEVIERPASIVKELVENSIDSGATSITVEIKNGGISFIRVTDNGSGFEKDDIPTAFLRHATSKIREDSDLLRIMSLGFRGEALSSIASVSKVELLTKKNTDFLGTRYVIEGGQELAMEDAGCPDGTSFFIRDLFYNVPARRKFLKSAVTEAGYINELVNRLAVSHCDIAFSLIIQGRTILHTSGNGKLKDCIYSVFGKEIADNLIAVDYQGELYSVSGFLGKSVINRGNRNYEMFFVNGRSIRSNLLYRSVEEAYASYLMQHKYPFTVLLFTMNPESIDVNIHPTKMDVRFSNQEELSESIRTVLAETLKQSVLIPKVKLVEEREEHIIPKQPEYFEQNRIQANANNQPKAEQLSFFETVKPAIKETDTSESNESGFKKDSETYGAKKTSDSYEKAYEINCNAQDFSSNPLTVNNNASDFGAEIPKPISGSDYPEGSSVQTNLKTAQSEVHYVQSEMNNYRPEDANEQAALQPLKAAEANPAIHNDTDLANGPAYCMPNVSDNAFVSEQNFTQWKSKPQFRILGQVFKTYWIVENANELYIIDQHAAHEKIIYERLLKAKEQAEVYSQSILPSIVLSLSIREEECLLKYMDTFSAIGFEISPFGGRDYQISAVPVSLYRMNAEDYFMSILDRLMESNSFTPERIYETIASMSCKAAIKGNQTVSEQEARHLIEELLQLENPFHCPHGRPIIISMTQYELEKKFKRIV